MRPDQFVLTDGHSLAGNPTVFAVGGFASRWHSCCITAAADGGVASKAIRRRLEASFSGRFSGFSMRAVSLGARVFA